VVAGRRSGAVHVDIRLPDSVRAVHQQVGSFDALVCTAGDACLGPFDSMSEAEFALGIESEFSVEPGSNSAAALSPPHLPAGVRVRPPWWS
jgi:NAD(P)-dependent dehydrogenase (short-subunit alcohol dehydrogenase family)